MNENGNGNKIKKARKKSSSKKRKYILPPNAQIITGLVLSLVILGFTLSSLLRQEYGGPVDGSDWDISVLLIFSIYTLGLLFRRLNIVRIICKWWKIVLVFYGAWIFTLLATLGGGAELLLVLFGIFAIFAFLTFTLRIGLHGLMRIEKMKAIEQEEGLVEK